MFLGARNVLSSASCWGVGAHSCWAAGPGPLAATRGDVWWVPEQGRHCAHACSRSPSDCFLGLQLWFTCDFIITSQSFAFKSSPLAAQVWSHKGIRDSHAPTAEAHSPGAPHSGPQLFAALLRRRGGKRREDRRIEKLDCKEDLAGLLFSVFLIQLLAE